MKKNPLFKLTPLYQALSLALLSSPALAGKNFLIAPTDGTLPTTITPGTTVAANYTLTNLTNSPRYGYKIVGLPKGVTQNFGEGTCGRVLNLSAKASCTLQLIISAPVSGGFAVCKGNSCTTVSVPLNVQAVPPTPPIPPSQEPLMIATGGYCSASSCSPMVGQNINGTWSYPINSSIQPSDNNSAPTPKLLASSCFDPVCIAAGYYSDGVQQLFTLAQTQNSGGSWAYAIDAAIGPQPTDYSGSGSFVSAYCNELICIAVGSYINSVTEFSIPALVQSTDGGNTWSYAIDSQQGPQLPQNPSLLNGMFNSVSCQGDLCIAVGNYSNTEDSETYYYTLLAQSTNAGSSWSYVLDQNAPQPPNSTQKTDTFLSSSCSANICIAVGTYEDYVIPNIPTYFPLLAQTTNGGASWTYAIDDTNGPKPNDIPIGSSSSATFSSASCSNDICIAAGSYPISEEIQEAMLVQSTDNGSTWTYAIDNATGPQLNDYNDSAYFTSTSCSGTTCIAGGYYIALDALQYPMLAETNDGGTTWSYVIDNTMPIPNYISSAQFNSVNCQSSSSCIAVGVYTSSNGNFPLLAEKIDNVWTYTIYDNAQLPSDYDHDGSFNSASISRSAPPSLLPTQNPFQSKYPFSPIPHAVK